MGKDVDLRVYEGMVLVNVASQCGLTNSNYTELTQLYEEYKDKEFEILGFSCNQFAGHEPGSNDDIQQFACTRLKAEFRIFDKVDVNGKNAAPVYKFLKARIHGRQHQVELSQSSWLQKKAKFSSAMLHQPHHLSIEVDPLPFLHRTFFISNP